MRRIAKWMARVAAISAALLAFGAAASEAQIPIDVLDARIIEGNSGTSLLSITVQANALPGFPITVFWRTVAGSAASPSDFISASGSFVMITSPASSASFNVQVQGDSVPEWSPTLQQDEVFFVELYNPTNGVIRKGRATVTIVDNDTNQPGVQYLSAVTDSTGTSSTDGRNRLQWRVAPAPSAPTQIKVCWNTGASCSSPISDTAAAACLPVTPVAMGSKQLFTHDNTQPVFKVNVPAAYCYSVFTLYPGFSPERGEVAVKTFDSTPGPVKWAFSAGSTTTGPSAAPPTSVVPPTVGADGIFTVGTDGIVQAMTRGDTGGLWPGFWNPVSLNRTFVAPAHNRSPVVPLATGGRLFVGTENGELHAIDTRLGSIVWSRAAGFPAGSEQLMTGANASTGVQATPAGLFKLFSGLNDLLLVGTATLGGNTNFFALDPTSGATLDFYPNGGDTPPGAIDNVFGMAVVDYGGNKVYFGTAGSAFTLWGLDLGPSGAPDLKLLTTPAWNPKPLGTTGGTTGSPVGRNGRLYLGTDNGAASAIHSLRISDGNLYSFTHGDGQVKGFVWPDRRDDRLYFSTVNKVHGVRDTGTAFTTLWSPMTFQSPSIPLQKPGTDYLYVGDGTGRLLQIDVVTQVVTPLQLATGTVQIGAPSLDNAGPNPLLIVGSDKGVIYAVRVPF